MTTVVDALTDATTAVNAALAQWQTLYNQVVAQGATNVTNITNIINNFQNRPRSLQIFVDPSNGSDTTGSGALQAPYRSLDKAIENLYLDGKTEIICLGDVQLNYYRALYSDITIVGATLDTPDNSTPYASAQRQLTFRNEALNSPLPFYGRVPGGFIAGTANITFGYLDIMLPNPSSDVTFPYCIQTSGQINANNVTIAAPSGSLAKLIRTEAGFHSSFYFSGSLGANAAGRVFSGVAAGVNPNNYSVYTSSLTSA
ncbi:hypothetical protein [Methylobacterium sp. WSM2598]|uniref:hypothetical protein n=1 Tax=Methylobacterium sp. WSM2598 TaxID=398261 RepID=UPI000376CB1D|nr:hypothetical protein [Methylobacterium sp. WSM2598]